MTSHTAVRPRSAQNTGICGKSGFEQAESAQKHGICGKSGSGLAESAQKHGDLWQKAAQGWAFGDESCRKWRQGCRLMDLWSRKRPEMAPGVLADGPLATNAAGICRNLQESAGDVACYARQDAGIRVYQLIVRVYTLPNRSLTDTVPEPVAGACTLNSV